MIKLFISLFLAAAYVAGCGANLPQSVNETPLTYMAPLDKNASFKASPTGETIAYSHRGLKLLDAGTGREEVLKTTKPDLLAWSADGRYLASASIENDKSSRVSVFSQEGALIDSYELPVVLNGLKWTAHGDLLAAGYLLKVYSFGSNLRQSLYRFADGEFKEIKLSDTTLKPATSKILAPVMKEVLPVHFSMYGDELVYVRLHDPPEFSPYVVLAYKNWQVGAERELQRFPVQALRIMAANDEDAIVVLSRDGSSVVRLWPKRETGEYMEYPYRFIDGRLTREGVGFAEWGKDAHFQLLNNGKYLLGVNKKLYLGVGLQPAKKGKHSEERWSLRRWRYEGLISNDEYHQMLKELNP